MNKVTELQKESWKSQMTWKPNGLGNKRTHDQKSVYLPILGNGWSSKLCKKLKDIIFVDKSKHK